LFCDTVVAAAAAVVVVFDAGHAVEFKGGYHRDRPNGIGGDHFRGCAVIMSFFKLKSNGDNTTR